MTMDDQNAVSAHETLTLQRAWTQLERWRSRVDDARDRSGERETKEVAPFVQELQDCGDQAENAVLRLQKLERAWQDARSDVDRAFARLANAWRSVGRVLSRR